MLRVLKVLEMAWLAIGIFSLLMGAYQFNQHGWEASQWFFAGTLMAGIFYGFRRKQRQRFEKEGQERKQSE